MIFNIVSGGFHASFAVTWPSGSTCKCISRDAGVELTGGTSGSYTFPITKKGTYYVYCTDGTQEAKSKDYYVSNGGSYSEVLEYPEVGVTATIKVTYPAGLTCRVTDGATTITAPNTSGYNEFTVPNEGVWSAEAAGCTKQQVVITENGQTESLRLRKPVTVTITGSHDTSQYTGNNQTVNGYQVTTNNRDYSSDKYSISGTATATQKNVGTKTMGLNNSLSFTNLDDDFNPTVNIVDGYMTVTPRQVTVTVSGHTGTFEYDGSNHTVSGYDLASDTSFYNTANVSCSITASVTRKDAGTTSITLAPQNFSNSNTQFDVTFKVDYSRNKISVTITSKTVKVTITGNNNGTGKTYDGVSTTISGYNCTFSPSNTGYSKGKISCTNNCSVTRKDAGKSTMNLNKDQFSNTDSSYNVTFEVAADGYVQINRKSANIKADNKSKAYKAADPTLTVTKTGYVSGEADKISYSQLYRDSGEESGTYPIHVTGNAVQGNYDVTFTNGTLTIGAAPVPTTGAIMVTTTYASNIWCSSQNWQTEGMGDAGVAAAVTSYLFDNLTPGIYYVYYTDGVHNNGGIPGVSVSVTAGNTSRLAY